MCSVPQAMSPHTARFADTIFPSMLPGNPWHFDVTALMDITLFGFCSKTELEKGA